eukprot:GHVQ01033994.1.p1 GENE.GHVQ01033994.1~~GHVQ01033994.1.p1  ORF type:complete len:239 (-),score=33.65 GHVQ01033994.1:211-927(-)
MQSVPVITPEEGRKLTGTEINDYIIVDPDSAKGLRKAKFIEDVDSFMEGKDLGQVVPLVRELLERFRIMEKSEKSILEMFVGKLPGLRDALNTVKSLKKLNGTDKEERMVRYRLSETMYAEAIVPKTEHVMLWLGANVLMDYPLDEAEALLKENQTNLETKLQATRTFLDEIRQHIVIMEVNMARLHNYGVRNRQRLRSQLDTSPACPPPSPPHSLNASSITEGSKRGEGGAGGVMEG